MPTFAILAASNERREALQQAIEAAFGRGNGVPNVVLSFPLPGNGREPALARISKQQVEVVLVELGADSAAAGLAAVEAVRQEVPRAAVFAIGDASQGETVLAAMRCGACEFLPRLFTRQELQEAVGRLNLPSQPNRPERNGSIVTVVNAKGGCGATTVAANLAVALQKEYGKTALVDLAPLGHAALHLNAQPNFSVATALRGISRLDQSLLEGLLTATDSGVALLAGMDAPLDIEVSEEGLRRMFDLLLISHRWVVVDVSSRLDQLVRNLCDLCDVALLVADANTLALLWSAARVQRYLAGERPGYDKINLVLNRFDRKFPLSDTDAEAATDARVLWKIPSEGPIVGPAVDSGQPVVLKKNSEAGRSLKGLAEAVVTLAANAHKPRPAAAVQQVAATFLSQPV